MGEDVVWCLRSIDNFADPFLRFIGSVFCFFGFDGERFDGECNS